MCCNVLYCIDSLKIFLGERYLYEEEDLSSLDERNIESQERLQETRKTREKINGYCEILYQEFETNNCPILFLYYYVLL